MIIEITHFVDRNQPVAQRDKVIFLKTHNRQEVEPILIDTKIPIFLYSCLLKFLFHIHPIPCNMQELIANHTGRLQGK